MKSTRARQSQPNKSGSRDAVRILLAVVFILFASIASREHDSAEKTYEQQAIAEAQVQIKRPRTREEKHTPKIPEASLLSRINGAI